MFLENGRFQFSAFAIKDVGLYRTNLEDAFYVSEEQGLFVVSDGVGGAAAGALAATITVQTLPLKLMEECKGLRATEIAAKAAALGRMIDAVESLLLEKTMHEPAAKGLGATVVAGFYVGGNTMALSYMGDSRAYLLRGSFFECLTQDHTVANMLYLAGHINREQLEQHPARHILTRYIGMRDCPVAEVALLPLLPGDRLLFCTDGLTNMVVGQAIGQILAENPSKEKAGNALISAANKAGGHDNIAVVIVDVLPRLSFEEWNGSVTVREEVGYSLSGTEEKTPKTLVEVEK